MKLKTYALVLLFILPLFGVLYLPSTHEVTLTPGVVDHLLIEANGDQIEVSATAITNLTLSYIDDNQQVGDVIGQITVSETDTYTTNIDARNYLKISLSSSSVSVVTIVISGFPIDFLIVLAALLLVNIVLYRKKFF